MNKLISLFLSRSKTNISILIFVIVSGLISYINIAKESKPDVVIPIVHVSVMFKGISSDDAERLLVRPLEQEISGLDGVKTVESTAFEGGANVIVEFKAGESIDQKIIDVRDRVDRAKPKFPDGVDDPIVSEINLSLFPILSVKLSSTSLPKRALYQAAKKIKDDIETGVSSVLKVNIVGDQEEVANIIIEPSALNRLKIPFNEIFDNIRSNNKMIPAGSIDSGDSKYNLKISGILKNVFDIMNLPIIADDVSVLKLKDVAEIQSGYKDPNFIVFDRVSFDKSEPAVVLEVSKRTGENLLETVDDVRKLIEAKKQFLPENLQITYANDESTRIRDMLSELQNNIILAIILVMTVIVFSLGWRSSLLVGIAIPGSFLMGIVCLSLMNLTINVVVLFSLIFSIGMLVDGAIIVVEYADRLIVHNNFSIKDAYTAAAKRMFWPVITSISTILVVFLPLLFWPGIVGQFMKYMPITLLCVLSASILMALVFIPSIAMSLKFANNQKALEHKNFFLEEQYKKILNFVLDHPKKTLKIAVLILIAVKALHSFVGKGIEFFPNIEPDQVIFSVHGRGSLSLKEKEKLVRKAEKKILDMKELSSVVTYVGQTSSSSNRDVIGSIIVEFVDWKERRKASKIIEEILKRFENIPGVYIDFKKDAAGPGSGKPIHLELSSDHYELIPAVAKKITDFMLKQPGFVGVENTLPFTSVEWNFTIDRERASKTDISVEMLGQAIQMLTIGATVGSYRPDNSDDEVDLVLRFPSEKCSFDYLESVSLTTKQGTFPISDFIKYLPQQKIPEINRVNGKKIVGITSDVSPDVLPLEKQKEVEKWIDLQDFSRDVAITFKGEDEDRKETGSFLIKAFGIAIFLVWLILLTQFNSFYKAALVLSAVVMSTVGVFVGLMLHDLPFGIVMGGIGIIALAGLIVSNNIILIDTFDQLMEEHKAEKQKLTLPLLKKIITDTCVQRLRPVFLTKVTAILGLLPILFRMEINFFKMEVHFGGPATEWWILLSVCIVYGLLFASSLTLLVTPCILWLKEKRKLL